MPRAQTCKRPRFFLIVHELMGYRIVRMTTWRGRLTISGEWRSCDYEKEMVVSFLEDMVRFMLMIAPDN